MHAFQLKEQICIYHYRDLADIPPQTEPGMSLILKYNEVVQGKDKGAYIK